MTKSSHQETEPITLVPAKNQLVTSNPLVAAAKSPITVWSCGAIGKLFVVGIVVFIAANLVAFDVIDNPMRPTPQPPATNYQEQYVRVELAKIEAQRDVQIAQAVAIGQWGRALVPAGFIMLLLLGLGIIIRAQTRAEQRQRLTYTVSNYQVED